MAIKVRNLTLNFDPTNPANILTFKKEEQAHKERVLELKPPEVSDDSTDWMEDYANYLQGFLNSFALYLDNVFGEDTAQTLLGDTPSLNDVQQVDKEIGNAIMASSEAFSQAMNKFAPNRAARRVGGKK